MKIAAYTRSANAPSTPSRARIGTKVRRSHLLEQGINKWRYR
jgi:hypothetical protein